MSLPTLADMDATRRGKPIPKGKSRLEEAVEAKPLTTITEKTFKTEVWTRDKRRCRWCGRKVQKTLERVPDRGEVHHLHGRKGPFRFEARCAILLCLSHHEKVTGRVAEKWIVVGTKTFELRTKRETVTCIDARQPVHFERVA